MILVDKINLPEQLSWSIELLASARTDCFTGFDLVESSGSRKNLTLLVLRLLDKFQFDIFSEWNVILIRPADAMFCHWQGIMVLIPSFLVMAFATNIILMYIGLALFSFGKYKLWAAFKFFSHISSFCPETHTLTLKGFFSSSGVGVVFWWFSPAVSTFSLVSSLSSNGLRMRVCVCLYIALA